jgi:hypothetical protein
MYLSQVGRWNDFSDGLKKKLEDRIAEMPQLVRYSFSISHQDPHPDNKGKQVWPAMYTLDPITFEIVDKDEDRKDKQKLKRVGIVSAIDDETGQPSSFERIRVFEKHCGVLTLDKEKPEDLAQIMMLELHPKVEGSMFQSTTAIAKVKRLDEAKLSREKRTTRKLKIEVMNKVSSLSDQAIVDFCDAMMWLSTEDVDILRGKVEEFAETNPEDVRDLLESNKLEYQAIVKKALDRSIISFDPVEYKYTWVANKQPLAVLQATAEHNEVERMAEWLMTNGEQGEKAFKKLKTQIK